MRECSNTTEPVTLKYRIYTGPVAVHTLAVLLEMNGYNVICEGTSHVWIASQIQESFDVAMAIRAMGFGISYTDVLEVGIY